MDADLFQELMRRLEEALTARKLLKKLGLTRKDMGRLLRKQSFRRTLRAMVPKETWTCREILTACREILDGLSPEPQEGWLPFLFADGKHVLYPENFPDVMEPCYETGKLFYMECLHCCIAAERDLHGLQPTLHFALLTQEEAEKYSSREEYLTFLAFCRETYLLEFLRISAEVTPFQTASHIAGVHYVSMHMATQLQSAGVPVDRALMSAAAIAHDVGKFGCRESEARRVPYLHYYYTDQCFKRHGMPSIAHIAANHSTWDLELENLSLESLLLIYADFRVKSTRENGVETVHFYTLADSFDIILNKLDNVDDAKRRRYRKVYNKLVDFEAYMIRKGVHTDMSSLTPAPTKTKDTALLFGPEIVEAYKDTAINHNILLMSILSHETSFTNILESARSEKDGKNTRTYLNIFREYCTYMNQRQKLQTIDFLYELLMHRESDIRREAAVLMGKMIANFDAEYRKEIPEGITEAFESDSSLELFDRYLGRILRPDHKLTEQHRMWLGYQADTLMCSVLEQGRANRRPDYLRVIENYYADLRWDSFAAFSLVNALRELPLQECPPGMLETFLQFALHFVGMDSMELQTAILWFVRRLLECCPDSVPARSYGQQILEKSRSYEAVSEIHLMRQVGNSLKLPASSLARYETGEDIPARINQIFLEDLKTGTPWICKLINIDYLKVQMERGANPSPVHTVTHLVNLLTGSDSGDVRRLAGEVLVGMSTEISHEQCNEVAVELVGGLELEENEFSGNIPQVLGRIAVQLMPEELDEIIRILENMLINAGDPVACVTLDTIGVILEQVTDYRRGSEEERARRLQKLRGLLLSGLAHDHEAVAQEACYVIGEYIFGSETLPFEKKVSLYENLGKKWIQLLRERPENQLTFLINAAALNHIYRFLSEYRMDHDAFDFGEGGKVAFFPGTFDPFSLSHQGIVEEIRKLGFEVYLAIDEFSWSKKTQPRLIRRRIAAMSTAADSGVFLFPDDIPVNLANPRDLKGLRELFAGRDVYIVAGSDVTAHASAYRKAPEENSIHHFNHIIFRRHSEDYEAARGEEEEGGILGEVVELSLPLYLEDVSSSRIRENIDLNRDISNLIDPMAQRYIYENNLYLREPQYKPFLYTRSINCEVAEEATEELWGELASTVLARKKNAAGIIEHLKADRVALAILRDEEKGGIPIAMAAARRIESADLYEEFTDLKLVRQIREKAWGRILLIRAVYAPDDSEHHDYFQIVVTELLSHCLEEEYTFCLYHSRPEMEERRRPRVEETLERSGFVRLSGDGDPELVMAVDMHRPYVLTKNIMTVIKEPFNDNPQVHRVVEETHRRLQLALTQFIPGNLVLSFDTSIIHHRLMKKITQINGVPEKQTRPRCLGEKMCVPFGKMLRGFVIPNTVTKALHTEKVFSADMRDFTIEEYPGYSPLKTQLRTIRSFDREVILVDDLLHSGVRLQELQKLLAHSGITVDKILLGVMTANGKDLAAQYGFETDCVYFIPNLSSWFVESSLYPFIGGDSIRPARQNTAGLLPSVNLILPYTAPSFLHGENMDPIYNLSQVCLENARDILQVLEKEYRGEFERNLTLNRLSEVILSPTCPDQGLFLSYNENLPASVYIENDIQRLNRLSQITGYARGKQTPALERVCDMD